MVHKGLAVGADLQVDFQAVAGGDRRPDSGGGVLDNARRRIMQPAMGQRSRGEPVEAGHGGAN